MTSERQKSDLDSENHDSFEIRSSGGFLTPKSRRKLKKGFWSSKESSEEGMAVDEQGAAPPGSGRSSRRSSIVSMLRKMSRGSDSVESCSSCSSEPGHRHSYRLIILGATMVGKTAIVSQFLYDTFIGMYKETVDDMYHGEFDIGGCALALNIQDTGGSYVDEFPAMLGVSLQSTDGIILVYSVAEFSAFEEVARLRSLVQSYKGLNVPTVVVGNKTDLPREISREVVETQVRCEWEHGYVECCAKDNVNITEIFRELLNQAKSSFDFCNLTSRGRGLLSDTPVVMRRRQSLPQVPAFSRLRNEESDGKTFHKAADRRSSYSVVIGRRDSCIIQ